jgi:hypothetical protein
MHPFISQMQLEGIITTDAKKAVQYDLNRLKQIISVLRGAGLTSHEYRVYYKGPRAGPFGDAYVPYRPARTRESEAVSGKVALYEKTTKGVLRLEPPVHRVPGVMM